MRIAICLLLAIPFLVANAADYPFEVPPGAVDRTERYEELSRRGKFASAREWSNLLGCEVLLVPGFLSDPMIWFGGLARKIPLIRALRLGEYFDEQLEWLKQSGLKARRVRIESEGAPERNAQFVRDAVLESETEGVILLTHSKGGIDTLEALLTYYDDLVESGRVRGWIPVQAPFAGSPIADMVLEQRVLRFLSRALLRRLGGSLASLESLATQLRTEYLEDRRAEIEELLAVLPVLSFTSWKDRIPWRFDTLLRPFRDCMEDRGISSDGLVPASSGILPGSSFVALPEVDHAVPVMECRVLQFDRIRFTRAVLALVLELAEKRTS